MVVQDTHMHDSVAQVVCWGLECKLGQPNHPNQIPTEAIRAHVLLAHVGEHVLGKNTTAVHLYQAIGPSMLPRCAVLGPVRCVLR